MFGRLADLEQGELPHLALGLAQSRHRDAAAVVIAQHLQGLAGSAAGGEFPQGQQHRGVAGLQPGPAVIDAGNGQLL